ncbi:fec operon regulator FecR [Pedobacter glucosidilyticus]|nr:FecR domain-containing protein [Pedobacter glucosidilyticus]KHJ38738.1 fec operon regulator FecR [Pedobacter glucosidilyticus]
MTDRDRFFELLAKKKLNNCTLSDIAEINRIAKQYDIDLDNLNQLDHIFNLQFVAADRPSVTSAENSWLKFKEQLKEDKQLYLPALADDKKPKYRIMRYYMAASVAAIFILLSIYILVFQSTDADKLNIISTQYGSKSKVEMPDGTQIWLNAGSKITYDNQYGKKTRSVSLEGEAFFDVHHDPKHPFMIYTKNLTLKVLGTAFNVRAFKEENSSVATLIRGSLEVSFPSKPEQKIILKPKEKLVIKNIISPAKARDQDKELIEMALSKVNDLAADKTIEEIAWTENRLIFRSKTFEELVFDLERWYNIKIEIEDDAIKSKRFTGAFKNETFFEALDALKETYAFDYKFNKATNTVTIKTQL